MTAGKHGESNSDRKWGLLEFTTKKHRETPLHVALSKPKYWLAKYICDAWEESPDASAKESLAAAIASLNKDSETCLHLAVRRAPIQFSLEILDRLVKACAPDVILSPQTENKSTVFHLLSHAKRCTKPTDRCHAKNCSKCDKLLAMDDKKYMTTLKGIAERCPSVLMTPNSKGESPYKYLVSTAKGLNIPLNKVGSLENPDRHRQAPNLVENANSTINLPIQSESTRRPSYTGSIQNFKESLRHRSKPPETTRNKNSERKAHPGQDLETSPELVREIENYLFARALSQNNFNKTFTCLFGSGTYGSVYRESAAPCSSFIFIQWSFS
jgi:hypothetical protein